MKRILLVEDDASLVVGLSGAFRGEGYDVQVARTGPDGLRLARESHPDVILLDLMLPGMSGLEICKQLRAEGDGTKIIILTSRSGEDDIVLGHEIGADDYVTKPFGVRELLARVATQLSGEGPAPAVSGRPAADRLRFDELVVDLKGRRLFRGGALQELGPQEFQLLEFLVRHAGELLSRDRLRKELWPGDARLTDRAVDRHIRGLRMRVEPDPKNPKYIRTVPGAGYRFDAPLRPEAGS